MNAGRIGGGSRPSETELRQRAAEAGDGAAFEKATAAAKPLARESFISTIVAARQPPPLSLEDVQTPSRASALFGSEIEALSQRDDAEVAGDLAEIYVTFSKEAEKSGAADLREAFDFVGETMLNYEHLRLLRTGQLG